MAQRATHHHSCLFALAATISVAAACPLVASQPGVANIDSTQDPLTTFSELLQVGQNWIPAPGYVYRYRRTYFAWMTAPELDLRTAQIAAIPDHPDHRELAVQRSRLEHGPHVTEFQIWWQSPGSIRFSRTLGTRNDSDKPAGTWLETASTPDVAWTLTGPATGIDDPSARGQLAIFDPSRPPPPDRNYATCHAEALRALALMLRGGLAPPYLDAASPVRASWQSDTLTGEVALENGRGLEFVLQRAPNGSSLLPVQLTTWPAPDRDAGAWIIRFSNWQRLEQPQVWVAKTIDTFAPDGRLRERHEWIDARPILPGEFEQVTAIPTPDGADAVRGPNTFTSVYDYRPGAENFTLLTPAGSRTLPLPPAALGAAVPRSWSLVGWISAGTLLAILVGIRAWRSRSRTSITS